MNVQDVKIDFQSRLNNIYSTKEISMFVYMLAEDVGLSKIDISVDVHKELQNNQIEYFNKALLRLCNNEPIQYIREIADFYGHEFYVNNSVLIPRQETEILVDTIIKQNAILLPTIVDLCTGSGCIINSIVHERRVHKAYAFDISTEALKVAQLNAEKLQVNVRFAELDILQEANWESIPSCDIIVSNPPYVRLNERALMKENVLDYEPDIALFVEDSDPLIFYNALAKIAVQKLNSNGIVLCEINEAFGLETKDLFEAHGFVDCIIIQDLHNKDRIIQAKKI